MLKGRVIDDFSYMNIADLVTKSKLINASMTGNKNFPVTSPTIAVFGAAVTAHENAVLAARNGGPLERIVRISQRSALLLQMKALMTDVNYIANGNREMLATTGFTLNAETRATGKKLGTIPAPVARPGNNSGEEILKIKPVNNATAHQFQLTTTPVTANSAWVTVPGKTRCTAKNLVPGTQYAVRVFVSGNGDEFAYSPVVIFNVI